MKAPARIIRSRHSKRNIRVRCGLRSEKRYCTLLKDTANKEGRYGGEVRRGGFCRSWNPGNGWKVEQSLLETLLCSKSKFRIYSTTYCPKKVVVHHSLDVQVLGLWLQIVPVCEETIQPCFSTCFWQRSQATCLAGYNSISLV